MEGLTKIRESSRGGGEDPEKVKVYVNVSIPEPPFQNLDVLHNLNSSGVSPSHPPPPSVKQLT